MILEMDDYKINLRTICERYGHSFGSETLKVIALFLINERRCKPIEMLYTDFLSRQTTDSRNALERKLPDFDKWRSATPLLTANIQKEMIAQLLVYPDIMDNGSIVNWYHFPHYNGFNFHPGVILNEDLELSYLIESHKRTFRYLFTIVFNLTDNAEELFRYHFHNTCKGDVNDFKQFILTAEKENRKSIGSGIKLWNYVSEITYHNDPVTGLDLILNSIGLRLIGYLKREYKNAKPQVVAFLLRSLIEVNAIEKDNTVNITKLHSILKESLGEIGTRQAFSHAFNKSEDSYAKSEIAKITRQLREKLKGSKTQFQV